MSAPTQATTKAQTVSTHIDETTYRDDHLDFQITVPLTWVHRYATVGNGGSVSFAFQTAASPGGTTQLQMANVFTVYRYGIKLFDATTCGCTELGRSTTEVYGYKFDGTSIPLVSPLNAATIKQSLKDEVTPTFQATGSN